MAATMVANLATGMESPERVMVALRPCRVDSRGPADSELVANARVGGATPLSEWRGDDATVYGY